MTHWSWKTSALLPGNFLRFEIGKAGDAKTAEIIERSERRLRRTLLRGRENIGKRYLFHVAGHNLGILDAPNLIGAGTPKNAARAASPCCSSITARYPGDRVLFLDKAGPGILMVAVSAEST